MCNVVDPFIPHVYNAEKAYNKRILLLLQTKKFNKLREKADKK